MHIFIFRALEQGYIKYKSTPTIDTGLNDEFHALNNDLPQPSNSHGPSKRNEPEPVCFGSTSEIDSSS